MTGFVIFIFGSVILGAGAMLSPAYPTTQPRIGMAGALALALVMGGAVFYGTALGWNTLVVDYMLFLLVVGIFLGGTLSYGQKRAEARGEELLDENQGWPGLWDLVGLLGAFGLLALAALTFPPAHSADWARSAQAVRDGQGLYLDGIAPGGPVLGAYLSQQLGESPYNTLTAIGVVVATLLTWAGYDFGAELRDKRLGRMLAGVMAVIGLSLLMLGQIGLLMAALWLSVMGWAGLRFSRQPNRVDWLVSGLMLGAVMLTEPWTALLGVGLALGVGLRARHILYLPLTIAIAALATLPSLLHWLR